MGPAGRARCGTRRLNTGMWEGGSSRSSSLPSSPPEQQQLVTPARARVQAKVKPEAKGKTARRLETTECPRRFAQLGG